MRRPGFRRHHLTAFGRHDAYPQIAEVIPRSRVLAAAQATGVARQMPALRRRWLVVAACAVLLIGALATGVSATLKSRGDDALNLLYLVLGAVTAALLLGSQEASAYLKRSEREAARTEVLDRIREAAEQRTSAWRRFVDALKHELADCDRDRCVIVDDSDKLDVTTRETLQAYLRDHEGPSEGRELWVVFEDAALRGVSKQLVLALPKKPRHVTGRAKTQFFAQVNLSEDQRHELAMLLGVPDRADFRRVRWIGQREAGVMEDMNRKLDQQKLEQTGDELAYGPLEILYLLAVTTLTGVVDFGKRELVGDLSSTRGAPAGEVLRLILPEATLAHNEVAHAVDRLGAELSDALDSDMLADERIELAREWAEGVFARRDVYELEKPGLVHLFWGLYWYTKLGGQKTADPYRLRKLGRHIVAATPPSALGEKLSPAASDRYVEAATWVAAQLLRASVPGDIPTLLERAEREATRLEHRRRLRSVCWRAYAVLGRESALGTLLRLHTERAPKGALDDLERLFVDSMTLTNVSAHDREQFAQRLRTLDRDILGYAQVQALWLALTIEPPTRRDWSWFSKLSDGACDRAAELVRDALARLSDPNRPRTAMDAMIVSLGTWSYALAYRREGQNLADANDLLEDVRLRAFALADDRREVASRERDEEEHGEDFVLRGVVEELEIVVSAAALVLQRDPRAGEASEPERDRLEDHARTATGSARSRQAPIETIAQSVAFQSYIETGWATARTTPWDSSGWRPR